MTLKYTHKKTACVTFRSSNERLGLADHLTKRLCLRTGTDETVVNFFTTNEGQDETRPLSDSVNKQTRGEMPTIKKLILKTLQKSVKCISVFFCLWTYRGKVKGFDWAKELNSTTGINKLLYLVKQCNHITSISCHALSFSFRKLLNAFQGHLLQNMVCF